MTGTFRGRGAREVLIMKWDLIMGTTIEAGRLKRQVVNYMVNNNLISWQEIRSV